MATRDHRPVVVLTALDVEYRAVRAHLVDVEAWQHPSGTLFEIGTIAGTDRRIAMAATGQGNVRAGVITAHSAEFRPTAVVFVEIAANRVDDVVGRASVAATQRRREADHQVAECETPLAAPRSIAAAAPPPAYDVQFRNQTVYALVAVVAAVVMFAIGSSSYTDHDTGGDDVRAVVGLVIFAVGVTQVVRWFKALPRGLIAVRDNARTRRATPPHIRAEIQGPSGASLEFLNAHLAPEETVEAITSAAARQGGQVNSLIVITHRRLLLVVPAPQVVAWRLAALTKIQVYAGYFFLNGDAGEYSPGLAGDAWGEAFERQVKHANAVAVLAGH